MFVLALIYRHSKENNILAMQFFLQFLQIRDLLTAWTAPRGPYVDQYDFTLEIRQRYHFPPGIRIGKVASPTAGFGVVQFGTDCFRPLFQRGCDQIFTVLFHGTQILAIGLEIAEHGTDQILPFQPVIRQIRKTVFRILGITVFQVVFFLREGHVAAEHPHSIGELQHSVVRKFILRHDVPVVVRTHRLFRMFGPGRIEENDCIVVGGIIYVFRQQGVESLIPAFQPVFQFIQTCNVSLEFRKEILVIAQGTFEKYGFQPDVGSIICPQVQGFVLFCVLAVQSGPCF